MYVYFKKRTSLSYFKKWDKTIHAEIAKSVEALKTYCQKSESRMDGPWTIGEPPAKCGGDRKTLDKDLVKMSE